ncbi:MAG: peptidylprolyl isomerase [Devosia sp.]|nr:peptidylprolyl isomerase [Devosia sp.]
MTESLKRAGLIIGVLLAAVAVVFAFSLANPKPAVAQDGKPHWMLELKDGVVDIELLPELAPSHVQRVVELTGQGFYDGIVFHRVIDGFMAQGGDPTGTGMGASDLPDLKAEFNTSVHFSRGIVAAARTNDPDSANSQFFIMFADAPWLDGQYTIWGKVASGMEFVDMIAKGEPPASPDKIISAKIEYK